MSEPTASATSTATGPKLIKAAEVAKHASRDDLWMVINGKVYDVTAFLDEHPGGEEVLIDAAGTDATDAFEDIGHSDDAREMLEPMYVGELDGPAEAPAAAGSKSGSTEGPGSVVPLFAALGVLLGVLFYFTRR